MTFVALKQDFSTESDRTWSRDEVLTCYRRLRSISQRHNSSAMTFLAPDSITHHARKLGIADGQTIVLDSEDELSFVFDLAIYTAGPGRSRAIDRYARSVQSPPGTDEAKVIGAMCNSRFAIVQVMRRHEAAGLIVKDMVRGDTIWLMDEGLEMSMPNESILATRLYEPVEFAMTAGVIVPLDALFPREAFSDQARLLGKPLNQTINSRQFAEMLYRIALANGWATRNRLQNAGEE